MPFNKLRTLVGVENGDVTSKISELEQLSVRVMTGSGVYLRGANNFNTDEVLRVFGELFPAKKARAISLLDEPSLLLELSNKHVAPLWLPPSIVTKQFSWSAWFPGVFGFLKQWDNPFWEYWADYTAIRYPNMELLYVHEEPTDDIPKKSVDQLLRGLYWAAVTHCICSLVGGAPLLPPLGYLNLLEQCIPFGVVNNELIVLCA